MNSHDIPSLLQKASAQKDGLSPQECEIFNAVNTGLDKLLGLTYTVLSPEKVIATINYDSSITQPFGLIHGGVHAGAAESVGSILGILASGGKTVVGVNNNTDILRPVSANGSTIMYEASIIHQGNRFQLINIRATVKEKLVAQTVLRTAL